VDQTLTTTITIDTGLLIHELWASVTESVAPLYPPFDMFLWKVECWL